MKYVGRKFVSLADYDSAQSIQDLELVECEFERCVLSCASTPQLRTHIRNARLTRCAVDPGCLVFSPILEDVTVDGLRTWDPLILLGAAYRHVILRGTIGRIIFQSDASSFRREDADMIQAFARANAEFYQSVDWALDIREADAKELDFRGIPSHLILRDPETQVVVERARLLESDWKSIPDGGSSHSVGLQLMIDGGYPDTVLVAPRRGKHARIDLAYINLLRRAGIANPD